MGGSNHEMAARCRSTALDSLNQAELEYLYMGNHGCSVYHGFAQVNCNGLKIHTFPGPEWHRSDHCLLHTIHNIYNKLRL
jgi:hypothetical protein